MVLSSSKDKRTLSLPQFCSHSVNGAYLLPIPILRPPLLDFVLTAYISANFPVPCATSNDIPANRHKVLPNIIAQVSAIYKALLSVFCDTCCLFAIQIPSGAVLPTSLLCKEMRKVLRLFDRQKAKNRGWRGLINHSNPCFSGIII